MISGVPAAFGMPLGKAHFQNRYVAGRVPLWLIELLPEFPLKVDMKASCVVKAVPTIV
jgi:hypothetical protein